MCVAVQTASPRQMTTSEYSAGALFYNRFESDCRLQFSLFLRGGCLAHGAIWRKENTLSLNFRASLPEEISYFRRVIVTAIGRIQGEKNSTVWFKVFFQIVEEKLPFRRAPAPRLVLSPLERRREGRDPIKGLCEIRQRLESLDRPDFSRHGEKFGQFSKERKFIYIHAQNA